jgi:16S rRNA (adenine1518-N6/adenine1519-N6)-dimethyltransferase
MSPRARRPRWGQNFLVDANVARAIVDWAAIDGRAVLEIGPGRGALTGQLVERARSVTLVEIDPALAAGLRERHGPDARVTVIESDVLELDLRALEGGPFLVVANLPYESATAIVRKLVGMPDVVSEAVVMLQKEVSERLLASAGTRGYGALSIFTALRADVVAGRVVAPRSFRPPPKVQSQVVRLRPLAAPRWDVGDGRMFEEIVRTAFGGRRKMLRNTLGRWLAERLGAERVPALLAECAIEPAARPEEVAGADFARLARRASELLEQRAGAS